MAYYPTRDIEDRLLECGDLEELREKILPLLNSQRTEWQAKMQEIMAHRGLTVKRMSQLCEVSEPAVRKWMRGSLPQSRDMYLRIGFAAGYDLAEMDRFLMRYGKYPKLYARSLEDCVCMFVLRSESLEHNYETYLSVLEAVKAELGNEEPAVPVAYDTVQMKEQMLRIDSYEEIAEFATSNAYAYKQAYAKLYSYVNAFLEINMASDYVDERERKKSSFHAMAVESNWSSSLRHCVSEIRKRRWFPLRHKIISLGLHLNMDTEDIDQMLRYAQMEPLYVKNPVEAAIMWAINEAKLSSEDDALLQNGSSELCDYVKDILLELGLDEQCSYLIDDL